MKNKTGNSQVSQNDFLDESQDIFYRAPSWYLKWGSTVVFLFLAILLLGCAFIKYPDIIKAQIVLTTKVPPMNFVTRSSGKIYFLVADNKSVSKGEIIAYLENSAELEDVQKLIIILNKLNNSLLKIKDVNSFVNLNESLNLGELQIYYLQLLKNIRIFNQTTKDLVNKKKIYYLQQKIIKYNDLNLSIKRQQIILGNELSLIEKKLAINEQLLKQKIIADLDFDQIKIQYLQVKRQFESSESTITNNDIIISSLESEINEFSLSKNILKEQQLNDIFASLKELESRLVYWQQQYLFISQIDGIVSILNFHSNYQYVSVGSEILTVIPKTGNVYGQVYMSISGSGKVEVGQSVRIKLDNYPYSEYGVLWGKIESISLIPINNMYTINIMLTDGLHTSYSKDLQFKQKLSGQVEIITENLSVLNRITYQFRSLLIKK